MQLIGEHLSTNFALEMIVCFHSYQIEINEPEEENEENQHAQNEKE